MPSTTEMPSTSSTGPPCVETTEPLFAPFKDADYGGGGMRVEFQHNDIALLATKNYLWKDDDMAVGLKLAAKSTHGSSCYVYPHILRFDIDTALGAKEHLEELKNKGVASFAKEVHFVVWSDTGGRDTDNEPIGHYELYSLWAPPKTGRGRARVYEAGRAAVERKHSNARRNNCQKLLRVVGWEAAVTSRFRAPARKVVGGQEYNLTEEYEEAEAMHNVCGPRCLIKLFEATGTAGMLRWDEIGADDTFGLRVRVIHIMGRALDGMGDEIAWDEGGIEDNRVNRLELVRVLYRLSPEHLASLKDRFGCVAACGGGGGRAWAQMWCCGSRIHLGCLQQMLGEKRPCNHCGEAVVGGVSVLPGGKVGECKTYIGPPAVWVKEWVRRGWVEDAAVKRNREKRKSVVESQGQASKKLRVNQPSQEEVNDVVENKKEVVNQPSNQPPLGQPSQEEVNDVVENKKEVVNQPSNQPPLGHENEDAGVAKESWGVLNPYVYHPQTTSESLCIFRFGCVCFTCPSDELEYWMGALTRLFRLPVKPEASAHRYQCGGCKVEEETRAEQLWHLNQPSCRLLGDVALGGRVGRLGFLLVKGGPASKVFESTRWVRPLDVLDPYALPGYESCWGWKVAEKKKEDKLLSNRERSIGTVVKKKREWLVSKGERDRAGPDVLCVPFVKSYDKWSDDDKVEAGDRSDVT